MNPFLERATQRRAAAMNVLNRLELLRLWSQYGNPVLVGAVRYGLVVRTDIDMEVYSAEPHIEDGFRLMSGLAGTRGVSQVTFIDGRDGPDLGLYWGLRCRDTDGVLWNVDCWHVTHTHPDAHWCERFGVALNRVLTPSTQTTILRLKEELLEDGGYRGIDVYRAVLQDGITDKSAFRQWLQSHGGTDMVHWMPNPVSHGEPDASQPSRV